MSIRCAVSVLLAIVLCAATQADEFYLANTVLVADPASDSVHSNYYWPDWSVDGRIVFEAEIADAPDARFELITSDLNGGTQQLIPYDDVTEHGWGIPRFSRDGTKIMGHTTGQFDRGFMMNSAGTDIQLLDPGPPSPDWYVAFFSPGPSADSALISDGSQLLRINMETQEIEWSLSQNAWGADWSPDGSQVVWGGSFNDLYLGSAGPEPEYDSRIHVGRHARFPSWSTTRDLIVFQSDETTCVVRPDGTGLSELVNAPCAADMGVARWSPDGQSIVYSVEGRIYRSDVVPEPGMMMGVLMLTVVGSRRR